MRHFFGQAEIGKLAVELLAPTLSEHATKVLLPHLKRLYDMPQLTRGASEEAVRHVLASGATDAVSRIWPPACVDVFAPAPVGGAADTARRTRKRARSAPPRLTSAHGVLHGIV